MYVMHNMLGSTFSVHVTLTWYDAKVKRASPEVNFDTELKDQFHLSFKIAIVSNDALTYMMAKTVVDYLE